MRPRWLWPLLLGAAPAFWLPAAEPVAGAAPAKPAPAPVPAPAPAAAAKPPAPSPATAPAPAAAKPAAPDKNETVADPGRIESTEKVRADFEVSFPVDI